MKKYFTLFVILLVVFSCEKETYDIKGDSEPRENRHGVDADAVLESAQPVLRRGVDNSRVVAHIWLLSLSPRRPTD